MEPPPFAGFTPTQPSLWGYGWSTSSVSYDPSSTSLASPKRVTNGPHSKTHDGVTSSDATNNQYVNMPAALINSLKREKKPFTYTPGRVDLSEVLSAKLQKRMDRRKKHSMEHAQQKGRVASPQMHSFDDAEDFAPQKQVLVTPTYNSPLNMYSMENAIEALEVQAELKTSEKSFSLPQLSQSMTLPRNYTFRFEDDYEPKNVTQSKAFRVLQIITDTEEEMPIKGRQRQGMKEDSRDEMRFTGIRENKSIPSKFFHTLQRITGTEEDEEDYPPPADAEMEYVGARNSSVFEKQAKSCSPQQRQMEAAIFQQQRMQSVVPQQQHQSIRQPNQVHSHPPVLQNANDLQEEHRRSPVLRRPAAFLPSNMASNIPSRLPHYHPPAPGLRRPVNPEEGTDF